jgi:hypothetical protein
MPARNYAVQPGPQRLLIGCPVPDVLYGGGRGGGKTWGLLLDWLYHREQYTEHSRGIIFRRTLEELAEVKDIAQKLFTCTGGVFLEGKNTWRWRDGSFLRMRYLERDSDAGRYQGHSYTWMAVDEMGNFPAPQPIDLVQACLRSGAAKILKVFRASCNPGGLGHNWIRARYINPAPPFQPFQDPESKQWRVYIPSSLDDNLALRLNDPEYEQRIRQATNGNDALWKAWRYNDWDIVAGGMFDDVWSRVKHAIKPFKIPASWYIDVSFDWGSSKPFSVLWWAESDGTQVQVADGSWRHYPPGTLFLIHEWYGFNGKPNEGLKMTAKEIAEGIIEREQEWGLRNVHPGQADSSIFDVENGGSYADDMAEVGVYWLPADKSPGTRKQGWGQLRKYLKAGLETKSEEPALFVFEHCVEFIRTVPTLPRSQKDADDVDTKAEDHAGDAARYRILAPRGGYDQEAITAGTRQQLVVR